MKKLYLPLGIELLFNVINLVTANIVEIAVPTWFFFGYIFRFFGLYFIPSIVIIILYFAPYIIYILNQKLNNSVTIDAERLSLFTFAHLGISILGVLIYFIVPSNPFYYHYLGNIPILPIPVILFSAFYLRKIIREGHGQETKSHTSHDDIANW